MILAALSLIATGCNKHHNPVDEPPVKTLSIIGAPESAVTVGEKFSLAVETSSDNVDVQTVEWSSSDPTVAKVNDAGRVLATGKGECQILASVGPETDTVSICVNDRDPANDEMGHVGDSKILRGQNNQSSRFSISDTPLNGYFWCQDGNNSVTYYDNGTFRASWSGTSNFCTGIGYYYGVSGVWGDVQYDCYFRHSKQGSGGGYNYIGIHGWTVDPLVEFYIVDDWYNKPGANLLGQKRGELVLDGETYEIYMNTRRQQPSILGTQTFPQYFSVRRSARQSGHIDVSAHFKKFQELGMKLGKFYELMYYVEVGGGSGAVDCTYLFMSDGKI